MGLKQRRRVSRKVVCGKGYCTCRNKQYVHGKGIMDIFNSVKSLVSPAMNFVKENADTLKNTAEAVGNVVKIGDTTKTIVQELIKRRKPKMQEDSLQNIVDKINQFKM